MSPQSMVGSCSSASRQLARVVAVVDCAITIRQPWARAIAAGIKTVENRGRSTSYRGLVAIHASRTVDKAGDRDERIVRWFGEEASLGIPLGAVLAVAELVDCHPASPRDVQPSCCQPWGETWQLRGGERVQAYHLVLANARPLARPVYVRCSLAVPWRLPGDVGAAVEREVAHA